MNASHNKKGTGYFQTHRGHRDRISKFLKAGVTALDITGPVKADHGVANAMAAIK